MNNSAKLQHQRSPHVGFICPTWFRHFVTGLCRPPPCLHVVILVNNIPFPRFFPILSRRSFSLGLLLPARGLKQQQKKKGTSRIGEDLLVCPHSPSSDRALVSTSLPSSLSSPLVSSPQLTSPWSHKGRVFHSCCFNLL